MCLALTLWQYSNSNFCSTNSHFIIAVLKTAAGVYVINPPGEAGTGSVVTNYSNFSNSQDQRVVFSFCLKCTIHDNIGTESGQWPVDGDPDTLVTYTRGVGEEGEKAEIRGPLGVPLDLGVRNNRRLRWPVVTLGDGSVSFPLPPSYSP